MNKILSCCAFVLIYLHLCSIANAENENVNWQRCAEKQSTETSTNSELECYREVAQEAKLHQASRSHGLAQEWERNNVPVDAYKQNYALLYAFSSPTNSAPTSPNPQNQVLTASPVDNKSLKFQFSMKHDLYDFGDSASLWFAYTQVSSWQVYDEANSRPFRENNYEPEVILSLRQSELMRILNLGVVHQSNGQSNPLSRSWNRVYIQPGMEYEFEHDASKHVVLLARLWQRISENPTTDDNPNITDYLGYGDIELRFFKDNEFSVSALARSQSVQLDFGFTWGALEDMFSTKLGEHATNLHIQYFSGYGESLIDYNHKHETWGAGVSFPFD